MNLEEKQALISYIEDKDINIDENWFYHGTNLKDGSFNKILKEGIKAPYLTRETSSYEYIFVSKKTDDRNGSFQNYIIYPRFIISPDIQVISRDESFIKRLFNKSHRNALFTSQYSDEYQVHRKISRAKIIGVAYDIYYLLNKYPSDTKETLETLHILSELLKEEHLPLIDINASKEINKSKVLSLKLNKM